MSFYTFSSIDLITIACWVTFLKAKGRNYKKSNWKHSITGTEQQANIKQLWDNRLIYMTQ